MNFDLIYIITNYGNAMAMINKANECGVKGATIFKGRGTVNNFFANLFSLNNEKKDVIMIATDTITAKKTTEAINKEFKIYKKNKGIMFTVPLFKIYGTNMDADDMKYEKGDFSMYEAIFTIVNRGNAEDVIEAARLAGSKGGTIINAKGSGSSQTSKIFNIEIDPEKEIVIILAKKDRTAKIVDKIREKLDIDKPNSGVIFVQEIKEVYGIKE